MTHFGRPDATGCSSGKAMPRDAKILRHSGPFIALPVDVLSSEAVRTLSIHGIRLLLRLMIEHNGHRRTENGCLVVTHAQAVAFGITRRCVAGAVKELEAHGLVRREAFTHNQTTGRRPPSRYRLTFIATLRDGAPPTDEWRLWQKPKQKRSPTPTGGTPSPPVSEPEPAFSPPLGEPNLAGNPPPPCGPTLMFPPIRRRTAGRAP